MLIPKHVVVACQMFFYFAYHIDSGITLFDIQRREQIIKFLDTKIKTIEEDPDGRWITTWNHYLSHLKYFLDGCIMHTIRKILKVLLPLIMRIGIIILHLTMIGKHHHLFKSEKRRQNE
jgi:hypothetical protein